MSSNVRPEIQRFCAAMNALIAEEERANKIVADKNKKIEADIQELLKTIQQKDSKLQMLENESKEVEAEQTCLDGPLREYQELEIQYQEIHEKESKKLEAAAKRRKELISSQSNQCMRDFHKLQEEMNKKLELMTTACRASQDSTVDEDRKDLEDAVYDLEREVNDLLKQVAESKKKWNERLQNVYGTDKKHREAVVKTMNGLIHRLRTSYINSKLQMHKLKVKNRKR